MGSWTHDDSAEANLAIAAKAANPLRNLVERGIVVVVFGYVVVSIKVLGFCENNECSEKLRN